MKITRCNQLVFYCIVPNCVWACSVASSRAPRHKRFLSDWGRRPSRLSTKYYRCWLPEFIVFVDGLEGILNEGTSAMRQWFQNVIFHDIPMITKTVTAFHWCHLQEILGNAASERLRTRRTRCEAPDGYDKDTSGWKQILSIYNIYIYLNIYI